MDKILIVSDTHRKNEHYLDIIKNSGPFDRVIHCGDVEGSELTICEAAGCPVEMVMGNNDFFSDLPRERIFDLGGRKVWLTHGHNYYASLDTAIIKEEAMAKGANVVMFGHTHRPILEDGSVICMNPGSLSYPRQANHRPSYIILNIDKNDHWDMEIKYL